MEVIKAEQNASYTNIYTIQSGSYLNTRLHVRRSFKGTLYRVYRHGVCLSKRAVASLWPFQLPRWPVLSVVGAEHHVAAAGPLGSSSFGIFRL